MSGIRFWLKKIIVVEVMLIVLFLGYHFFGLHISVVSWVIDTGLKYLTPVALIAVILSIIFSILSTKIVEIAFGIVLGGLILYYLIYYVL